MKLFVIILASLLSACTSTPYHPAVVVPDSKPFVGMAQLLHDAPNKEIDVILVHGMCTHKQQWALDTITAMARAANHNVRPLTSGVTTSQQGIDIVSATTQAAGGTINFSAFIWSGLTKAGKQQLAYDATGTPNDCATEASCKPQRAKLNGIMKDKLLNDCLSDALIYQGKEKAVINKAFVDAITAVVSAQAQRNVGKSVPLILISESLGSKMTFDALNLMRGATDVPTKRAGDMVGERISYLYMGANQLPLLSLADQEARPPIIDKDSARHDALSQFLEQLPKRASPPQITVVAFTDPNDQLSYRLLQKHYSPQAAIANILVSNAKTYFGLFANPYAAHTTYLENEDVTRAIVCGMAAGGHCR